MGSLDSFLLVDEHEIKLYGSEAGKVYQKFKKIYHKWLALGKPRMLDYHIEFIPLTHQVQANSSLAENSWMIDRHFYRQIVRLG